MVVVWGMNPGGISMGRRAKIFDPLKTYNAGDQIHITITQDFVETATKFFRLCAKHHYSPSEVIRGNISDWVDQTSEMVEQYERVKKEKESLIGKGDEEVTYA